MKKIVYIAGLVICLMIFGFLSGLLAYKFIRHNNTDESHSVIEDTHSIPESTDVVPNDNSDPAVTDSSLPSQSEESKITAPADTAGLATESEASTSSVPKAAESVPETTESVKEDVDVLEERDIPVPEHGIDWAELQATNSDIYAWIYVPNSNIDYPILQHPEERSYYLMHNIDHSEGYPGCIYTQNVNSKDWTDPNTVIYGHNMNNGSMFHDIHKFEDADYFNSTQFFYIYTPEGTKVCEVFAAYPFDNVDLMMCFDYSTPEAVRAYFNGIWTNQSSTSHFREEVVLDENSKIVTLTTCIGGQPDRRYLVQAVLLNP